MNSSQLSGTHKTQLLSDALHAAVVLAVVTCVTVLAFAKVGLPPDVIGTVYGGAIGYAAGRAGNVTRSPLVVTGTSNGGNGSSPSTQATSPDIESIPERRNEDG